MKIQKITIMPLNISKIFLVGFTALLLLVLPQLNSQEYVLPTITTKFIYFLYGCSILAVLYSLILVFTKSITFSFTKLDVSLSALLLYITLNRYFIQSDFGFSIRYMELLCLCFLYVVLRNIALKNYPWLLLAIVISGIIQAVYGNLQLLGYYPSNHSGFKMTGSFFNPGPYAGFLASVWPTALGMYLFKDAITTSIQSQTKNKAAFFNEYIKHIFEYIPLLGLITISLVLPALQSRASWMAVLVGTTVLLELRYRFLSNMFKNIAAKLHKKAVITLSIGIVSVALFSLYHYKKASSDGRAFIWKVTSEMITDHSAFGVGFDLFKAYYMVYQAHYFHKNGETSEALVADNTYYAFNEWLQFVAENGFFGFILLLIVGIVLIQTKAKPTHLIEALIAKTGLVTIGIFACFSYPMQILPIKLSIVVLLALLSNCHGNTYTITIGQKNVRMWGYKLFFIILSLVSTYKTFVYTKDIRKGFVNWNNAINHYEYGDYDMAIQEFELAYPIFKKDGDFLMNYGKTLSMAEKPYKAIALLQQAKAYQNNTIIATSLGDSYKDLKRYDKAEVAYQQAIIMIPSKFYANYLLAKLYDVSGQRNKAIIMAKKLLDKEIKIPSKAIKEIREEMKKILIKYKNPLGF